MRAWRVGFLVCGLLATFNTGAQQPRDPSTLVLSLKPSKVKGEFQVGLRNEGPAPVHVLDRQ